MGCGWSTTPSFDEAHSLNHSGTKHERPLGSGCKYTQIRHRLSAVQDQVSLGGFVGGYNRLQGFMMTFGGTGIMMASVLMSFVISLVMNANDGSRIIAWGEIVIELVVIVLGML